MRTRTKVMLAVGAIALGTTAMVGASLADGRGGRPSWRRLGRSGGGDQRLFEQFDSNQDGLITQVEIDQVLEAGSPRSMRTTTAA